jgi:hypothetical protein
MKKTKLVIWLVFIAILVAGLPMWFTSNHNHINDLSILLPVALLLAIVFSVLTKLQLKTICFVTVIGVIVSIIIKIIIDTNIDPTSHNLFPFEILIDGFFVLLASLIGAAIGIVIRLLIKSHQEKHAPLK